MRLDQIEYEHIQATSLIMRKLSEEEAAHVLFLLTEWATALGYAIGMTEGLSLQRPMQERPK